MKQIKKLILYVLLYVFKFHLKIIYFFIKLFVRKEDIVFLLSRQSDELPLNYRLLIRKFKEENINYKYICKSVPKGLNSYIRNEHRKIKLINQLKKMIDYYFNLYKQMYYCAKSKVIIIDGYNIVASILNHKNTTIIQLWHALAAIKKFGYQTIGNEDGLDTKVSKILCMHKNYDYVISGSKSMNRYFSEAFNTDIKKVVACGTPSRDYLLNENKDILNKIYYKYPILKKKINILYSPTFRSDGSDNYDEVIKNVDTNKYNLILTFHPKNKSFKDKNDIIVIDNREFMTFDILRVADYVITDYSALMIDACILDKKILLYVYDYDKYKKENGLNIDLFKELKGNISTNINDLLDIIDKEKYNYTSYSNFKRKYTIDKKVNSTCKLVEIVKENIK